MYSQSYSSTQTVPPTYHPGYVQTKPILEFPGASTQQSTYPPVYPLLNDLIARQAWLFTQPEFRHTQVFGLGVQQASDPQPEIDEVHDEDVHEEDMHEEDEDSDTDRMLLSRASRGFRVKTAKEII